MKYKIDCGNLNFENLTIYFEFPGLKSTLIRKEEPVFCWDLNFFLDKKGIRIRTLHNSPIFLSRI